jgi:uncharacterized membrane protein
MSVETAMPPRTAARAAGRAPGADLAAVREDYEDPWVVWNAVRTVASTAALGCLVYALVLYGRTGSVRGYVGQTAR